MSSSDFITQEERDIRLMTYRKFKTPKKEIDCTNEQCCKSVELTAMWEITKTSYKERFKRSLQGPCEQLE